MVKSFIESDTENEDRYLMINIAAVLKGRTLLKKKQ